MTIFKQKQIKGLGWDDERFVEGNAQILGDLITNLSTRHACQLQIEVDETDFRDKFKKGGPWDFLVLDVMDKQNVDKEFGFTLAAYCRGEGFQNPIFLISSDRNRLINNNIPIKPPCFLFSKMMNSKKMAFEMYNLLDYYGITQSKIFIGHGGQSMVWKDLQIHISEQFNLECIEFNSGSAVGLSTTNRLWTFRSQVGLAILIMTGEDPQADQSVRARQNVIHEIGFFQSRLGYEKVIVMREEGCDKFSNFTLQDIPFDKNNIAMAFPAVVEVLKRERFITDAIV